MATIEAIYHAVCENFVASKKFNKKINNFMNSIDNKTKKNLVNNINSDNSYHKFDNLLFWFFFFRFKVNPEKRKNNR